MKRQHFFQVAPSRSICLFCLHRLQQQANPASSNLFQRGFTSSVWIQQHSTPGASISDPDIVQSPPRDGNGTLRKEQHDFGYANNTRRKYAGQEHQRSPQSNGASQAYYETKEQPHREWAHLLRRQPVSNQNLALDQTGPIREIRAPLIRWHDVDGESSKPKFVGLQKLKPVKPSTHANNRSRISKTFQQKPDGFRVVRTPFNEGRNRDPSGHSTHQGSRDTFQEGRDAFQDDHNGHQTDRGTFHEGRNERSDDTWQPAFRTNNKSTRFAQEAHEPLDSIGQSRRENRFGSPAKSEGLDRRARGPRGQAQDDSRTDWPAKTERPSPRFREASTYDATPARRKKLPRQSLEDRRFQKFDLSADAGSSGALLPEQIERNRRKQRQKELEEAQKALQEKRIELPQFISVRNLANVLRVRVEPFMEKLYELGFEDVAQDHVLDFENASLVASEYNYLAEADRSDIEDLKARPPPEDVSLLLPRPPVVTIMGHVDHGKTTLLDYLRKSSVAAQEHGGITQHIGAFSVPLESGKTITFLDTPGHAAFLSMRRRGANVTDIVILVVAADDSVKPQTVEAIKHAKAANVPIIVAINKIDKHEADVQGVKQDLARHEIEVEDFGGDVQAYPVSGKTGEGINDLIEAMTTQAEIIDMRAETDGPAEGWVLEATTKKSGRAATILVRRGTLKVGDVVVAGTTWARVRTLKNEAGVDVEEATPGTPVEVEGWREQPMAGDEVLEAESEQKAASVVDYRLSRVRQNQDAKDIEVINESRKVETERRAREKAEREQKEVDEREKVNSAEKTSAASEQQATAKTELYFIIKADVSGSAEAVEGSLTALPVSNHPIAIKVLRTGVGAVSEFDIDQASTVSSGNGFIVSFNQQVPSQMSADAELRGIRIIDGNIIYRVVDEIRTVIESKLPPVIKKRVTGEAEIAQVFDIDLGRKKTVNVAGCRIRNGIIGKGRKARVYRGDASEGGELVYDGTINTLKSHKKDVDVMRKGSECGIGFEKWEDMKPGDIIQCYEEDRETRRLT